MFNWNSLKERFSKRFLSKKNEITEEISALPIVTINGVDIEVKPLTLERTLEFLILLSPYLVLIEDNWQGINLLLQQDKNPNLLSSLFLGLRDQFENAPQDIVKAFAILLDLDSDWVAENAKPTDLFLSLEVLDKQNNFVNLWYAAKYIGLIVLEKDNG